MRFGSFGRYWRPILAGYVVCLPGSAWAQQVPTAPVPQTSQPGRDQITIPTPAPARAGTVTVRGGGAVLQGPCPDAIVKSDAHVALREVRFANPSGEVPPVIGALLAGIAPPAGDQSIAVVCALRDEAVERLRGAGYVAAVQIPPQDLADGVLVLNVITAQLTQVRVVGDAGRFNKVLADRIERLKRIKPLNEREVKRILLLAGDIPGLSVQLTLHASPSGTVGEVVGDLEVRYEPLVIVGNAQNFGSRQLGRETGYLSASIVGLTGLADVTTIAASSTADFDEQLVGQVGHHFQLGSDGLTLGGNFTYALSRPDLGALQLHSRSMIGTLDVSYPLVRTISDALTVGGGIDIIEQRTQVFGNGTPIPLNRDRLRVAFLRVGGSVQGTALENGRSAETHFLGGSFELRQGLGLFGASRRGQFQDNYGPSRPEGNPKATVARANLDGRVRLGRTPLVLAGAAQGQWSSSPLLNFDEYSLGNLTIGRGYDPGSNSADRAIATRAELRVQLPFKRVEVQPFGFWDNVWLYNLDSGTTENGRHLRSFGGGARLTLTGYLYLEVMYAHPQDPALRLTNARRPTDRVLVSLTARFAPRL